MEWLRYAVVNLWQIVIFLSLLTTTTTLSSGEETNDDKTNGDELNQIILERQQIPWLSDKHHSGYSAYPAQQDYYYESLKNTIVTEDDENNANNDIPVLVNSLFLEKLSAASRTYNRTDVETTTVGRGGRPRVSFTIPLPVVNRPFQVVLLTVILTAAVFANGSVILNISKDSLKLRMVHFLLIRHVCITDCIGALFVIPVPLLAIANGEWYFGEKMCSVVSTTTAAAWTMHLIAVAFYRVDRVLAVWLPTGKYPVFSVRSTNIFLVVVWLLAISGAYLATWTFGPTFQPALALCIPNVPLLFFVVVFSGYCIGLITLTTGYVFAFTRRRRRKRKRAREAASVNGSIEDDSVIRESQNETNYNAYENSIYRETTLEEKLVPSHTTGYGSSTLTPTHRRVQSDDISTRGEWQVSASPNNNAVPNPSPVTHSPTSNPRKHRRVWSESQAMCVREPLSRLDSTARIIGDSTDSSFYQESDNMIQEYDQLTSTDCSEEPDRFGSSLSSTMGKSNLQNSSSVNDTIGSGSSISLDGVSQQKSSTVKEKSKSSTSLPSSVSLASHVIPEKTVELRSVRPVVLPMESHSIDQIFEQCNNNELLRSGAMKRSSSVNGGGKNNHCNNNQNHLSARMTHAKSKTNSSLIGDGWKAARHRRVKHFKPKGSKASPARKVLASYAVSVGHLLLYLPAMFVIGLKGRSLPPGVALLCGLVVYCEFIVQPVALLLISPRLRGEVKGTLTNKKV